MKDFHKIYIFFCLRQFPLNTRRFDNSYMYSTLSKRHGRWTLGQRCVDVVLKSRVHCPNLSQYLKILRYYQIRYTQTCCLLQLSYTAENWPLDGRLAICCAKPTAKPICKHLPDSRYSNIFPNLQNRQQPAVTYCHKIKLNGL